ncbi:hypothetical protein FNF27_07787 [Cafeteria roenbergensis]|uniref:Sodium/hydrogen exchanger n=1 Tax=Cafeteria roenbergensis TaxID=33653 RepID=A0A5A8CCA2_CAFRO|nr:hypothetical protein FNF31_07018 [Cafeteria roenbergensis]KAA0161637.1 hypothetical protein FNF28_04986 [Cafeteria roenbergensis]KAA0164532.1 hypothetical protein FNF27_07787 [Cafeteria roenbergensis]
MPKREWLQAVSQVLMRTPQLGNSSHPDEEAVHEFASITVIAVIGLIALTIVFGYFTKKYKIYWLPESGFTMMLGMLVGGIARLAATPEELQALQFNPELFFFVLLPPIIFEAGYNLKRKRFFRNFSTIIAFAVLGTVISTFVIGFLVYAAALGGVAPEIDTTSPLQSLMFGALISAVDPVATLAIMGTPELNCDKMLYSLVFGESVLNDAVAIVLFKTFEKLTVGTATLAGAGDYFEVFGLFLGVSLGSVVCGVLMGLLACVICKYTNLSKYPSKEITLLLLFSYLAYAVAEAIFLSGIMSLFFCGIVLSHYNWHNLSAETQAASTYVFHALSHTSETVVFAYVGICVFTGAYNTWNWGFIAVALLICLFARAANIFPISFMVNLARKKVIPLPMQGVIWFAGLRGAIAFALAINMPQPDHGPKWNNDIIATTTLGIVVFTTVVCGGLTEPMLERMGMKKPHDDDEEDQGELLPLTSVADPTSTSHRAGGLHATWRNFDSRFMRPWFGGKAPRAQVYSSASDGSPLEGGPAAAGAAAGAAADPRAASPFAASTSSAGPARGLGTDASSYQAFGADDGDIGAGSGSFFGATPHGSGTI